MPSTAAAASDFNFSSRGSTFAGGAAAGLAASCATGAATNEPINTTTARLRLTDIARLEENASGLPGYRTTGLPDYRTTGRPDQRPTRLRAARYGEASRNAIISVFPM